jgi:hypothetical protein
MGEGADKWSAEERIRPWEASFPSGTDSEFITALAAQTPNAWATPLLVGLNALAFVAMTIGGVDPWSPAAADLISWGANYGSLTTGGEAVACGGDLFDGRARAVGQKLERLPHPHESVRIGVEPNVRRPPKVGVANLCGSGGSRPNPQQSSRLRVGHEASLD